MKSLFTEKPCIIEATMTVLRLIPKYGTKASKAKWTHSTTRAAKQICRNVVRFREGASLEIFEFYMRKNGWKLTAIDNRTLRVRKFFHRRVEMVIDLKELKEV